MSDNPTRNVLIRWLEEVNNVLDNWTIPKRVHPQNERKAASISLPFHAVLDQTNDVVEFGRILLQVLNQHVRAVLHGINLLPGGVRCRFIDTPDYVLGDHVILPGSDHQQPAAKSLQDLPGIGVNPTVGFSDDLGEFIPEGRGISGQVIHGGHKQDDAVGWQDFGQLYRRVRSHAGAEQANWRFDVHRLDHGAGLFGALLKAGLVDAAAGFAESYKVKCH